MKKVFSFILAASMMLAGTVAMAQPSISAGFANANTKFNISVAGAANVESKPSLNGFYVGGAYNFPIGTVGLGVAPGIYFSYLTGSDVELLDIKVAKIKADHMAESYLSIPVDLNFSIPITNDVKALVYAGPTFSYGITSKIKFGDTTYNCYSGDLKNANVGTDSEYLKDLAENYKRFDIMLGGGVGVEFFDQFRFNIGYDFGLLDRCSSSDIKINRNQLNVGVAYLF